MVANGQIWEYRRDPKYSWRVPDKHRYTKNAVFHTKMAWQIVGGEFRGTDLFWTLKVIRDEDGWLDTDTHTFSEGVFETGKRFRLIYDPAQDSGVFCGQCGQFYPYANYRPDFACWGCRNGY